MESMKTDSLKCDADAPAVEPQHDDNAPVSTKTEAFECKRYVGPVATVDGIHHCFRNDSTGLELLESASRSEKTVLEYTEGVRYSGGTSLHDDDSRPGDSRANFEMRAAACQQDGSMMPSKRANGFDDTITADDSCPQVCCAEQGIPVLSPKGSKMEEEAAVLSFEGYEGHVAVPVSFTRVSQEVTSTAIMVSNQVELFEVAATGKPEGRKFVDANFHDLEENQLAEHAYDMDFDIDAPLEESFFDESCMFPALDAEKSETWHAGLDGVITEESSAQLHSNQHTQLVDMKSLPLEETDSEPVTEHELKENVASNEEWLHNTQRQEGGKTVLVDALHGVEKASDPSNRQGQGLEELASYLGNEIDSEILASDTVQDKELTCNYSKDNDAREIQGQYDTDCTFDTSTGENLETVHATGTCEAERLEEEVKTKITVMENEIEPASINAIHVDAAVYLHEFDGPPVVNSATADYSPVSNDVELHLKAGDLSENSRLNSCIGQEVIGERQGKEIRQGSGCLDFVKKSEYDMKSNTVKTGDQLLAKNKTSSIDSLGAPCTDDRPALILSVKTEPEHVPICCEESSVIVCREMSTEDVSEPLAHEESNMLEQNAKNDKPVVNANELQYCHVESDIPYTEGAQNQSDTPMVMDRNPVKGLCDGVLVARSDDVKEICECRVETLEVINVAEQEAKASNNEHEQSDQKFVEDSDGSVLEPSEIELKEINVGGDEILEGSVTEHETSDEELKQSDGGSVVVVDASVPQPSEIEPKEIDVSGDEIQEGSVAEHEPLGEELKENDGGSVDVFDASVPEPSEIGLKVINASGDEIQEGHVAEHDPLDEEQKQSTGESVDVFDGSLPETRKCEVDKIFDSGDGIIDGEVALPEQGIAFNEESEDHSSMPLAGDLSPPNRGAEEPKKQELSSPEALIHLPILSDTETNVDSGAKCTETLIVLDGSKDGGNPAPAEQSVASMEQSREVRLVSSVALAKKQSKVRSDDKLPKAELSNKSNLSTVEEAMKGDYMVDYANAECQSKREEKISSKKMQKHVKQGLAFGVGDLVWAKVKSHPWWPAQIFDPADASKSARKAKKPGRVLVAFFGDCTFAWLQQFQMIAFRPNFKEKVQQTTMRFFCLAVEEALEELCRRSELGLSCKHFKGSLHSTSSFPDANTGIRAGVRVERLKNICTGADMFKAKKTLDFMKNVAASPLGAWSYTLQWAESRGHAYGLRTCMVAMQGSDLPSVLLPPTVPTKELKLKRSHSSLNAEDIREAEDDGKESQTTKKLKKARKDSDAKGLLAKALSGEENKQGNDMQVETSVKFSVDTTERNKDSNAMKITLSKKVKSNHLSSPERRLDRQSGEEAGGERNSDDSKETMLALTGLSIKTLKRSRSREEKISSNSKKVRRQIDEESQDGSSMHGAVKAASLGERFSDMDADDSLQTGAGREDIFSSPLRAGVKKTQGSKMTIETRSKREASGKDNSTGKNKSRIKLSKVRDSQGTPIAKVVDDDGGFTGAEPKKDKNVRQASLMRKKVFSKESSEGTSLLQLRWDVEPLAEKAVSGGAKGKAVQQLKKGNQVEAVAAKFSPEWQCVPHRSEKSCVQELALAARKRKSEIVHDEVLSTLPKSSSTTSSQREHASKAYITSAEDRGERESYDKSLLLHSRRPAPPTSMISSSQRYDEKLSSHAPLGLFMRFPEDFPLPSEAQLKATFIPFGPLQMSATRLYKDSASAQVVFKHGRDAESALKHAKENPMFGLVAVTYRLRHLSTRVETKGDTPSSIKAHPTQAAALKESASSRKKLGGSIGDKELLSSVMLRPCNLDGQSGSEPTGDIQDQMMTLLRQVSAIVNTSPVM